MFAWVYIYMACDHKESATMVLQDNDDGRINPCLNIPINNHIQTSICSKQ